MDAKTDSTQIAKRKILHLMQCHMHLGTIKAARVKPSEETAAGFSLWTILILILVETLLGLFFFCLSFSIFLHFKAGDDGMVAAASAAASVSVCVCVCLCVCICRLLQSPEVAAATCGTQTPFKTCWQQRKRRGYTCKWVSKRHPHARAHQHTHTTM